MIRSRLKHEKALKLRVDPSPGKPFSPEEQERMLAVAKKSTEWARLACERRRRRRGDHGDCGPCLPADAVAVCAYPHGSETEERWKKWRGNGLSRGSESEKPAHALRAQALASSAGPVMDAKYQIENIASDSLSITNGAPAASLPAPPGFLRYPAQPTVP
jgi:hypothetical protein